MDDFQFVLELVDLAVVLGEKVSHVSRLLSILLRKLTAVGCLQLPLDV